MRINCPKCNTSLEDLKGGGTLTKCPKCGLDGTMAEFLTWLKTEWEIENRLG